ncbi:prepilin peptidase [Paenibacillus yanchengensis]|uniref:Prepilin peptidase n=1 Tax=Paenibacillus yanchengensis TaxID=2035833 RepID=A0ABW4YFH8_9BACL
MITNLIVLLFLILALYTDVRWRIIPNKLAIIFFIASWLTVISLSGTSGLVTALLGLVCGFVPMFIIYLLQGIGAGDVKWFAVAGICLGSNAILQLIFYSILYAGIIGCLLLLIRRTLKDRLQRFVQFMMISYGTSNIQLQHFWLRWAKSGTTFPFMIAVFPAFITIIEL